MRKKEAEKYIKLWNKLSNLHKKLIFKADDKIRHKKNALRIWRREEEVAKDIIKLFNLLEPTKIFDFSDVKCASSLKSLYSVGYIKLRPRKDWGK